MHGTQSIHQPPEWAARMTTTMEKLYSAFGAGLDAQHLTMAQVALRAVLVFMAALVMVRMANKRFFAKKTAFDVILGLILASMLARAINGSEQLGPTIAGGFVLVLLHRVLGFLACRWHWVGNLVKGHSETLVEDSRADHAVMEKHHISEEDLAEDLRLSGVEELSKVKLARLERSGQISVVKRSGRSSE